MTVSETYRAVAPPLAARPARDAVGPPPRPASPTTREEVESAEEIVARLERWIAASESETLRTAARPDAGSPPTPPPLPPEEHDDLLPSEPGWSAIFNEDVAPFGLATVACLVTLLAYVALGLRNGSIASGVVLLGAITAGRRHGRSALATRIIVGVALGVAIACLS